MTAVRAGSTESATLPPSDAPVELEGGVTAMAGEDMEPTRPHHVLNLKNVCIQKINCLQPGSHQDLASAVPCISFLDWPAEACTVSPANVALMAALFAWPCSAISGSQSTHYSLQDHHSQARGHHLPGALQLLKGSDCL